jgi:P-type Ca2+ transporter type 2C
MDDAASPLAGLGDEEAAARLRDEGFNEVPAGNRRTVIGILLDVVSEPMFALLLGAAVVYLALGDLKEAVVLAVFASTSVSIALVQEARTERVIESLRHLTSPRALVIRGGVERRIPGREVVRGDRWSRPISDWFWSTGREPHRSSARFASRTRRCGGCSDLPRQSSPQSS